MPVSGRILRIEKLSTFDGEGLRTVVFLKGCPLSCQWCSTPESQRQGTDFGVARNKCTGCFSCVEICPEQALTWNMKSERFITDLTCCKTCLKCTDTCPTNARESWGYTATTREILSEVEKDSLFYFHSGGGVTMSGGEPMAQADFVSELLEQCLGLGINTAIETSGQVPWENIKKVLPFTDTLFYDLKHMDDQIHKELTGAGNKRIMDNLRKIDASTGQFSLIVRMPIIPGLNDTKENIQALGEFCKGLNKITQIQLLPYHRLGIETYTRMSLPYSLEETNPPEEEVMEEYRKALVQMNIEARIGG
jgi:pyruvate formate lyase activating enzyme